MLRIQTTLLLATALLAVACRSTETKEESPSIISTAKAAPPPPPTDLDPSKGSEIGLVFEGYMTPDQEPAEESETPSTTPSQFKSTTDSMTRAERVAAGHKGVGQLRFTKDLSRAYVDVRIEGIDVKNINMFHIHCGKPGILGPIVVDFSDGTDIQANFTDDNIFSIEITNELIVANTEHAHGVVAAFTTGCVLNSPSLTGLAPTKVSTVAGLAQIAKEGELYFNLHTTGQTYYGDIRGQISLVDK